MGNKDAKKIPVLIINNRQDMQPIENAYEIITFNKTENVTKIPDNWKCVRYLVI